MFWWRAPHDVIREQELYPGQVHLENKTAKQERKKLERVTRPILERIEKKED